MIPPPPARPPQAGFLYVPPYRIQGWSIAGEESVVQVPELDLCFDIGRCPRFALTSKYVALSHGHMDHCAGLAYYFSQRHFQDMSTGTVICHAQIAKAIHNVMAAWIDLEVQKTPYHVVSLAPDEEHQIKNNIYLRAFPTDHTVPSLGFVVVERRSKLLPELVGLPQEQILAQKNQGQTITRTHEIPLVCYTGDTMWGNHFERPDVLNAKILITECTFLEPSHRHRASVGRHLHVDDILVLLKHSKAEVIVLTHLSRRTHMAAARAVLKEVIPLEHQHRILLLMDNRTNRARFEGQINDAEAAASDHSAVDGN